MSPTSSSVTSALSAPPAQHTSAPPQFLTARRGPHDRTRLPAHLDGAVALSPAATPVLVSRDVSVGARDIVVIAGPCAVEGRDMILTSARAVRAAGATMLRGGVFKPRTSPYAFQGLGVAGLELLAEAREVTGLPIVTEVMDTREVERVAAVADVLQIGARSMQNFPLLAEAGRSGVTVLLKRNAGARVEELLLAAEYVMAAGNARVILCERGIRTFETGTRNTLDVAAVPVLKRETHLPVLVDPSHAGGRADLVAPLAMAAIAAGADGLLVEVHPDPQNASSDREQQLTFTQFAALMQQAERVAAAVGRGVCLPAEPTLGAAVASARLTPCAPEMMGEGVAAVTCAP